MVFFFFFFPIMWCSWSGDHPWGTWFNQIWPHTRRYESRKKTESFYILGYLLELIIEIRQFGFYYFWNLANLSHFFSMKNPLYRSKPYFSGGNLPKQKKKGNAASRAIGMKNGHCGTQGTRVRFTMFTLTGSSLGKSRALTAACWRHICDRQI